jgi:hypothetical protein
VVTPWELVIYHNNFFLSINEKTQCIAPGCVRIFCYKEALDALWKLSQRRYRGKEVTISTFSLPDIWGSNSWKNLEVSITVDLTWSFPYIAVPFLNVLRLSCHGRIEDGVFVCLEVWVFPQLTLTYYLFIVNILESIRIKRELFDWSLNIHITLLASAYTIPTFRRYFHRLQQFNPHSLLPI